MFQYLCPPAEFCLEEAPQGEGGGPGDRGTPGEEPQSLGQLHPFLKGELHLHHDHDCGEGVRALPGEEGKESDEATRDDADLCLQERKRGERLHRLRDDDEGSETQQLFTLNLHC